jgi:glycosyltransferase involved in cell wall biosynthesis
MKKSFHIVTPSYNQGEFIERTIDSVLANNPKYYWIIDGDSTDSTLDILRLQEKKLQWISEEDTGQPNAINKGFSNILDMEDDLIVGWVNSDDLYLPDTLKLVEEAFSDPTVMWVTGDVEVIDANDNVIDYYHGSFANSPSEWLKGFAQGFSYAVLQPATFWRASIFKKAGFLREDLQYSFDHEFFFRIFLCFGKPYYLPKPLAKFRLHGESKTVSQSKRFKRENQKIFGLHKGTLSMIDRVAFEILWLKMIMKDYVG